MAALQDRGWKVTRQISVNDYKIYFSGMVATGTVIGVVSLYTSHWYQTLMNLSQFRKGSLITQKKKFEKWREYFIELFNNDIPENSVEKTIYQKAERSISDIT